MKHKILLLLVSLVLLAGMLGIPVQAATQPEIDQAIQDGLAWLATQQQVDGRICQMPYSNPVAATGTAVLAFENEGHFPGGATLYSGVVEAGLDFIFQYANIMAIGLQPHGDPDTDGDGWGVYFYDDSIIRAVYETGIVMQAIVASNTPSRVVTTGACSGWTYEDVMVDLVDWCAFGQEEAGQYRGGWRYTHNQGTADNSTSQWPVLGLVAAEQWGIYAPQFVKDELNIWIDWVQNDVDGDANDGGSGYSDPNTYVNIAKTGGLLVEMYYVGDDNNTARAQAAIDFIDSRWNDAPGGTWYGNKGHSYAMFSVFKGLELMEVANIPSAPANAETPAGDWWGDYCEFIVNAQAGDGHWDAYYPSYWNTWLSTGWYIVILQATIFPVQVAIDVPPCACDVDGYDVDITYSIERFQASGTLEIYEDDALLETVSIVDFQGAAAYTYPVASDTAGMHTWKAVLDVTTSEGVPAHAEDTDTINVCETPDVLDIPDQTAPFETFDLDDYIVYGGVGSISWTNSIPPLGWTVAIDGENVVTVTAPEGAGDPVIITFTASTECCSGVVCSDSDDATFIPNLPPDCSETYADPGCLWPPNHKFVDIVIMGVTDPDGDPITINIDAITSDEPTALDLGSGGEKHAPDASGIGTDTASVRAERSGTSDGRVYMIWFTASDGRGGECEGSVMVKVPHDQSSEDCAAIDSGQDYDATQIN